MATKLQDDKLEWKIPAYTGDIVKYLHLKKNEK